MQITTHKLANGLRIVFVDTKAFSTITTLLLVGAGSRYENKKNNGIAHFFEHMAFKGSKKYPNSFLISSTIEGIGGLFNAFTAKDHTGYWIKATNDHFNQIVDVISDMVTSPLLNKDEIQKEKGTIIEEINFYEDTPYRKVNEYFEGLLYQGNSLGYEIIGTKENIRNSTQETFTKYIQNLYQPQNAVFIIAGGLGGKETNYFNLIKEKLNHWQNKSNIGRYEKVSENQTQPQILIKNKKTEQSHFCLGYRTFSFFDERKYALNVLSTMLGGGMSSRLFMQVRERRGLCYYISTGREHYSDTGNIVTQTGIVNDLKKIKEAIKIILQEQNKIIQGDFSDEEIAKAKELIKGRLLINMEDSSHVASFFAAKYLLENKLITTEKIIQKLEAVTKNDIQQLASQIFLPQNLNFALVGPFENNDFARADFIV